MSEGEDILYEVKDKVAIITFNIPSKLNALTGNQYLLLAKLVERADDEEDTTVTLIQSTGKYFSAGANIGGLDLANMESSKLLSHELWLEQFVARNTYLTDLFHNHKKVLVAAVNGPVIGLSASLVALCDLVYVKDLSKFYFLTPFSNLGLVAEGAASATLFLRLGWSKASEALLFSRPITGLELDKLGFINKSFDGKFSSTEEFNNYILKMLVDQFSQLYQPSIFANKQLMKVQRDQLIGSANSKEVVQGLKRWINGIPQDRFVKLMQKEIKHKL